MLSEELTNSRWFRGCPMYVIFNKYDEFCQLIQRVPFSSKIPDYHGRNNDPEDIIRFMSETIRNRAIDRPSHQLIFLPPINALNQPEVQSAFGLIFANLESLAPRNFLDDEVVNDE